MLWTHIGVFHPDGDHGGEDVQCLPNNGPGFNGVSLQQTMKNLAQ